jgi:hypothetical protein
LSDLVGPFQSTFIEEENISDNIFTFSRASSYRKGGSS